MATVYRRRQDMAARQLPIERESCRGNEGLGFAQLLEILDRPLRSIAGDDLPLLQIYRCTVIGALFATFGAVLVGALT